MPTDVRMRGFRERTSVVDVLRLLQQRIAPLSTEVVSLRDACGRHLSADIISEVSVPAFQRAAMDGYAIRAEESFGAGPYNPLELEVVGEVLPGRELDGEVQSGQAVRIMTGAPVPKGADSVVMAEHATESESDGARRVALTDSVTPGRHVGQVGEDIAEGTVVLTKGRRLRPQDLGVLASIGCGEVVVHQRPRVTVLITGDELLPCGAKPKGVQIVDSNSVMLSALITRDGAIASVPSIVKDGYDSVKTALVESVKDADLVMISGGSSVGKEDDAPQILSELGELPVHGVALRPASPTGVGFVEGTPVLLMPGNPVSCLCAYDLFAGPILRRLSGATEIPIPAPLGGESTIPGLTLPLARKISSVVGRVDYVRAKIVDEKIEPLATSGASILSSTTRADGYVLIAAESEGCAPGDRVLFSFYS